MTAQNAQAFANPFKIELPADKPLIIMSRTFDAPLELLWTVWTKPEHIAYWFGPREDNEIVEYDVRTGGKWRVISTMSDGSRIVFYGTYLEVRPKTMIRNTFVVEGLYEEDDRYYEEHHFEERNGKTYYHSVSNYTDFEQRQQVVDSGMEWGANVSMVKVDELLEKLKG